MSGLFSRSKESYEDRERRDSVPTFHPEYGRFMLESTPGSPYTGRLTDILSVEENMRYRYAEKPLSTARSSPSPSVGS